MGISARSFFTPAEQEAIRQAIMDAELNTSGEIRIHIENRCSADILDRAAKLFDNLGMKKTALRNGILIYLAILDRKFAIIGDYGINRVVPANFWDDIKNTMTNMFKEGKFSDGLIYAATAVGQQLKKHFPYHAGDINELSDDISFGK
jgi:uncharacterized membrane protein